MRFRNLWLTIGFGLVLLVAVASLMPNPLNPAEFKGSDKVRHFAAYAFMDALVCPNLYEESSPMAHSTGFCHVGNKFGMPSSRPSAAVAHRSYVPLILPHGVRRVVAMFGSFAPYRMLRYPPLSVTKNVGFYQRCTHMSNGCNKRKQNV